MFTTIFNYEFRYWLRQPIVYVYAIFFFLVSTLTMWGMASEANTNGSLQITNAPLQLNRMANLFHKIMLFLLPSIFGVSIYRDFSSRMHFLLYSFPFSKRDYLFAKFASALCVAILITVMIGVGFVVGTQLPGVQNQVITSFNAKAYLHLYLIYIIPNLLLFGAIVFAVVCRTRNVYAGFITVIILVVTQAFLENFLAGMAHRVLAAIISPFGKLATEHYTRYWTIVERNQLLLPVDYIILSNRILWLSIASLIFGMAYRSFSFKYEKSNFQFFKKTKLRYLKDNFNQLSKVQLSTVSFDFSRRHHLRTTWLLAGSDFKSIVSSWSFISIVLAGSIFIFFQQMEMNPLFDFKLLPLTWRMLNIPSIIFSGIINFLTFLYAGVLLHRAKLTQMNQLVDISPLPNWVFLGSKVLALVKMQVLLTALVLLGGISVQITQGYYHFEIGNYLFELFVLNLLHYVIWACLAIFVHVMVNQLYLGFFLLLLVPIGMITMSQIAQVLGIDFLQAAYFRYNQVANFNMVFDYSDLTQYGNSLSNYFIYKFYWLLAGTSLLCLALLFWQRGFVYTFAARWENAKQRFVGKTAILTVVLFGSFLSIGASLYYEDQILYTKIKTDQDQVLLAVTSEKKYKRYEQLPQPKITDIKINLDFFPSRADFVAQGKYILVNKTTQAIDTLLIHYSYNENLSYHFDRPSTYLSQDDAIRFDVVLLSEALAPGAQMEMYFTLTNQANTLLRTNSNVQQNGSFLNGRIFPRFGYRDIELKDKQKRATYGLPEKQNTFAHPADSTTWKQVYGDDADLVNFEAIVSTEADQTAIAPGRLHRTWTEKTQRYFHYRTDQKIPHAYSFHTGNYQIKRDQWREIPLEVYYHPTHSYNVENILRGIKASLAYCTSAFSPFQMQRLRVVEYPKTLGTYATVIADNMPYSELYFIGDIDTTKKDQIDFPFYVSAHEIAHYWWGKQINPANALGAKMLTESLAEYVALKTLEKTHGKSQMRQFLKFDMDAYLQGRANESQEEMPLSLGKFSQDYINYRKGALVFYALSEYLGEDQLNAALRSFSETLKQQANNFGTSLQLIDQIRPIVPDSFQYLLKDLFETITLYDNQVLKATSTALANGTYQVDIVLNVRKYRSDGKGNPSFSDDETAGLSYSNSTQDTLRSLVLNDYLEVAVYGAPKESNKGKATVLYFQKHRFEQIHNRIRLIVAEKPTAVSIDPDHKFIDSNTNDNQIPIED